MDNNLTNFDKLKSDITLFVEPCKNIVVVDKETQNQAIMHGQVIKSFKKQIKEVKDELLAPLLAREKLIRSQADSITEPLDLTEDHIKSQLLSYQKKLDIERLEAQKKLDEEKRLAEKKLREQMEKEKQEIDDASAFMQDDVKPFAEQELREKEIRLKQEQELNEKMEQKKIDNMRVKGSKKVWTFEIIDKNIMSTDYLIPDEKKIREAIRSGVREMSGVRIYQEDQISIR